jgi:hypothetical protein
MLPRWTREILEEIGTASPDLNAESSAALATEIKLQIETSSRSELKILIVMTGLSLEAATKKEKDRSSTVAGTQREV